MRGHKLIVVIFLFFFFLKELVVDTIICNYTVTNVDRH